MPKKLLIIPLVLVLFLAFAFSAKAAPTSWDFAGGILQPLQSQWAAVVKGSYFQATSTTASIFPYASTTALSATSLCLSADCRTTWPSGGSGGAIGTSTPLVSGQVVFSTGVDTVGNDSAFLWDSSLDKLTTTNASTTNLSVSGTIDTALTANSLVATDATSRLTAGTNIITAANVLNSVNGTTGTAGNLVFSASPTLTGVATIGTIRGGTGAGSDLVLRGSTNASPTLGTAGIIFQAGSGGTTEAGRFDGSTGFFGLGTTSPGTLFSLGSLANFTTATSTFYSTGGLDLTGGGCFAINGTCIGGASGITAIGPAGQTQTGATQTLATSTSAFNGLTPNLVITASGDTQTFTSTLSGLLGIGGGGTGTSTAGVLGQVLSWNGTNWQGVATSTLGLGGGGTPGGASGDIQYNNAGAFGGFGNWDGSGLIVDGYLNADSIYAPDISTELFQLSGYNPGSVLFLDSGAYAAQSSNLFFDEANARLGIGTSTPGTSLSVGTTLGANITGSSATSTFGGPIRSSCFTVDGTSCITGAGGSGTVGSGTTGQFPYYAANGTTLTATSSLFMAANGYIGVGTTSPDHTLHVYGDQTGGVSLFERVNSATNAVLGVMKVKATSLGDMADGFGSAFQFYIEDTAGVENYLADIRGIRNGADNSGILTFNTSNAGATTEKMVIMNDGKVGIGTTSPTTMFNVSANESSAVLTNNTLARIDITNTNSTNNTFSALSFSTVNSTGSTTPLSQIIGVHKAHTTSVQEGELAFITRSTPAGVDTFTEKMRITSDGKVGIGTSSPYAALSVFNATSPQFVISAATGQAFTIAQATGGNVTYDVTGTHTFQTNGSNRWVMTGNNLNANTASGPMLSNTSNSGTNPSIIPKRNSGTTGIGASGADALTLITSGANRVEITSAGLVGVGTTSPWRTFSVSGSVAMSGLTSAAGTPNSLCITAGKEVVENAATSCLVSSARFKHDIEGLDLSGTMLVSQLKPSTFTYNEGNKEDIGFIAEEVALVDPRFAEYDSEGKPLTLRLHAILSATVKAVQEIIAVNDEQDTRLDALEARIEALEQENGGLKAGMCPLR